MQKAQKVMQRAGERGRERRAMQKTLGMRTSQSLGSVWQTTAQSVLPEAKSPPPPNDNHPSILSVSSSFLRANGKEHDTSCLTLPVWSATTGRPLVHKIQSIGDGWVSRAGVWGINGTPYFQSAPPLYHGAFVPSSQTSRPETRQQQGILSWVVSHLSSIMIWSCLKVAKPVNCGQAVPEACHCAACPSFISLKTHCSPSDWNIMSNNTTFFWSKAKKPNPSVLGLSCNVCFS